MLQPPKTPTPSKDQTPEAPKNNREKFVVHAIRKYEIEAENCFDALEVARKQISGDFDELEVYDATGKLRVTDRTSEAVKAGEMITIIGARRRQRGYSGQI